MLKSSVRPISSFPRRMLFPFFYPEQFLSLLPFTLLAAVCALVANDVYLLPVLFGIGYFATSFAMRRFIPHVLEIPRDKIALAIEIINGFPNVKRVRNDLKWNRKIRFPFLRSNLDSILVTDQDSHFLAVGRKDEMIRLERALIG